MKIVVVIPAFNEAKIIKSVVEEVLCCGYEVVVVDDCSHDSTHRFAQKTKAHVLRHYINRGQGAALATGIDYALTLSADIVVTFDADGQHKSEEIALFIEALVQNEVDVVLGSRFLGAVENMTKFRWASLKASLLFMRLLTGLNLTDVHNGFRAFTSHAAKKITIKQSRMAHASEIIEEVVRHNLRYKEVPVTIHYTEYTKQKSEGSVSRMARVLQEIIVGKGVFGKTK